MVQRHYDNFSAYSYAKRYWFVEAMIQLHENSDCPHCKEPVHKVTEDRAYGPEYEPDMRTGDMEIRWMCHKCHGTGDYTLSWKHKQLIPVILHSYKDVPDKIHKLLVFNIWERIGWKIKRFLNKEVPTYAI